MELVAGYIGVSPGELDPMDHVIELSPVDDHAFLPGLTWLAPFGDKPGAGDQVPGDPGLLPKKLDHVEAMGNVDWAEAAVQIGTATRCSRSTSGNPESPRRTASLDTVLGKLAYPGAERVPRRRPGLVPLDARHSEAPGYAQSHPWKPRTAQRYS